MTSSDIKFIGDVELNRGVIKSIKHKDMLVDILKLGTTNIQEQLTGAKLLGIKFYWDLVQRLNHTEQEKFLTRFLAGTHNKLSAQIISNDILLNRTCGK